LLIFINVFYVPGLEHNFLSVSQIMRRCPHLDIIFSNHRCYVVEKETKKAVGFGVGDLGLFTLVDIGEVKEHVLVARSASDICTLWH
jgi:hypothetical protein